MPNIPLKFALQLANLLCLLVMYSSALAESNAIESVSAARQNNSLIVKIKLQAAIPQEPINFKVTQPARIAFDFADTDNATGKDVIDIGIGHLLRARILHHQSKTTVVLDLDRLVPYVSSIADDTLLVAIADDDHPAVKYPDSNSALSIHVKGVDARGLVGILADLTRQNIVIGDELRDERIDISESSISAMQLIQRLASNQRLAVMHEDNIALIASSCRLAQSPQIPALTQDQQKISFNFKHAGLGGLMSGKSGILSLELNASLDIPVANKRARLTIAVRDGKIHDHIRYISIVEGWDAQASGEGLRFVPNPAASACLTGTGSHHETANEPASVTPPLRACPEMAKKGCSQTELYELAEFKPVGLIRMADQPSSFAILDNGSQYFLVKEGDYIGRNLGKIKKISATEIDMTEVVQNADGLWEERPAVLHFP